MARSEGWKAEIEKSEILSETLVLLLYYCPYGYSWFRFSDLYYVPILRALRAIDPLTMATNTSAVPAAAKNSFRPNLGIISASIYQS